jgi:hypothetical protein
VPWMSYGKERKGKVSQGTSAVQVLRRSRIGCRSRIVRVTDRVALAMLPMR